MAETAAAIDGELEKLIPTEVGPLANLMASLRYSAIGGGKRLRPFLTLQTSLLFSVPKSQALCVATAIELVHCYSLVHDDLPAMDNDDLRRGKPTNHKVFGDGLAILAGDGLLTLAFATLNGADSGINSGVRSQLTLELAKAAGINGMIGGQAIDLQSPHQTMGPSDIRHLQELKTGALICFAVDAGAILGSATRDERDALKGYASSLGSAFQIVDDLLDMEGNSNEVGKKLRKDTAAGKATLVSSLGIDEARREAQKMTMQAQRYLECFGGRAELLREVTQFLFVRNH
jgi:farnesyl diphosphate synthase